jgi:N-acetylmuramoyl-L-alanine amidase
MVRPRGNLIIGGQVFNVDAPVVNWRENGWDATSVYCLPTKTEAAPVCPPGEGGQQPHGPPAVPYTKRYSTRPNLRTSKWNGGMNPSYEAVKATIKQFVVHHDGCTSADMCFSVLQNERGLSVHFLLDNDGTIYQTIDLGLMAYHAADWNLYSIGVELCSRGDATTYPGVYTGGRFGPQRETKTCKINGHTIKAYDYTPAQYDAFSRLCRELLRLFPNLPADYPQSSPGVQTWDTLTNASIERERYAGYIAHYHLTQQKWDPGPFDFKEFCGKLRGALCFPVFPKQEPKPGQEKPIVPDESSDLKQDASALYELNEARADGGFFPVGPWGETRLWHGGIHVIGKPEAAVFSPYPGRLVAARMGRDSAIGSFNFVLLRHEMALGSTKVQFYSLYMHLADELKRTGRVEWMSKVKITPGEVGLLDEPIEAGAVIGHIGRVGPEELARSQIHVEFFSEQFIDVPEGQWQLVDGTAGGRICDAPEINSVIDRNKDGKLSREELREFFANGSGELHRMVTLHVSEWTAEPNWRDALLPATDFKAKKPTEIDQLIADQITPGLWWDARVANHCRLPQDGVVYHYHPVAFISWFKNQLIEAAVAAARTGRKIDDKDIREVPKTITDDGHDTSGASMRGVAEGTEDPCNKSLTLEQMVQGFDAPECTQ